MFQPPNANYVICAERGSSGSVHYFTDFFAEFFFTVPTSIE